MFEIKFFFNFNIIGFIKKYTIGLFINNETKVNNEVFKGFNFLSEEDFDIIKSLKEKFTIELNEKEGYIKVIASDESAFISTQLVEIITKNLQLKIIELRTNKIKERLNTEKEKFVAIDKEEQEERTRIKDSLKKAKQVQKANPNLDALKISD